MNASTAETDIDSKCDSDICGQYFKLDDEGELIIPSLREILDERKIG